MKLRWLTGALALAAFSAAPWMVAQQDPQSQPTQNPQTQAPPSQSPQQVPTTDPDEGKPKASDVQNAPKKDPGALPTQDDSQLLSLIHI